MEASEHLQLYKRQTGHSTQSVSSRLNSWFPTALHVSCDGMEIQLSQKCTTNYGGGSGSGFISNMALVKVSKNVICVMTGSPSHRDCANSTLAHTHMLYMSSE